MKKSLLFFALLISWSLTSAQSTLIQSDRVTVPKMTTVAKNALPLKVEGNMVYDTDLQQFSYWTGTAWVNFGATVASGTGWVLDGTNVINNNSGNVGIGTGTGPNAKLHVSKGASGVTPNINTVETIENNGNAFLSILTPAVNTGAIAFGNPTNAVKGGIYYNHSSNQMDLQAGGSSKIQLEDNHTDIKQELRLTDKYTNMTTNTTYAPFDRTNKSYVIINTNTSTATIHGFTAPVTTNSSDRYGTLLFLVNDSPSESGTIILKHESASVVAADRIKNNFNQDITFVGRGGGIFIYDLDGWRLLTYIY